jgi:type VI secretion system secreted protein Hcp
MAVDMFLKIEGVPGESADKSHKDEIDVLSWSWGMTQSGTTHTGTGGGAGKVNVRDVTITKYCDKASPVIMQACCSGKHFKEAKLTVRKAGENPLEYLKITMKDLLVSSVSTGGTMSDDRLTENVTLNFAEYKVEYTPQQASGTGGGTVVAGWQIAQNVKL